MKRLLTSVLAMLYAYYRFTLTMLYSYGQVVLAIALIMNDSLDVLFKWSQHYYPDNESLKVLRFKSHSIKERFMEKERVTEEIIIE